MHDAEAKACITVHRHELLHKLGPMTGNTCIFVPELWIAASEPVAWQCNVASDNSA